MNKIKLATLVMVMMSVTSIVMAQPPTGGAGAGGSGSTPIDGGVVALLAGAIAYGYRSLKAASGK